MIGIADTGFLVAFANRTDRYHDWATGLAAQVTAPLYPNHPVITVDRTDFRIYRPHRRETIPAIFPPADA